jgi:tetratricopeptide (TPR) repeat protein
MTAGIVTENGFRVKTIHLANRINPQITRITRMKMIGVIARADALLKNPLLLASRMTASIIWADMKRPQLVPQGSLNRILQASEEAWSRRDFQQAIDHLERATRLAPANCQILLQLGRVYGLRCNYAAAEKCFEKAIRVAPNKTEMLATVAERATDFPSHELAEKYFQCALEQKDASANTFTKLAELYERLHRMEEASTLLDRALHLEPNSALALLTSARFNRQTGKLEEAERLMRSAIKAGNNDIRIRGYYELGMILDRQGRYDEAMAAFLDAKALLRPTAGPLLAQLQELRAYWEEMQANISTETFQNWFNTTPMLQPAHRIAFLGGYPRSGTTLLEQVLDSHPDLVSAEETTLFNDEVYTPLTNTFPPTTPMLKLLESAPSSLLNQLRENYFNQNERHINNPIGTRLLIDKNPSINVLIPAFIRVFPEIKLLIALRDPRDVCLSCFMQAHLPLSKGSVAYLTLEGTIEGYARVMGLWRTLAPMLTGHYLEVRYEEMVEDLESVSRRTLDFLNVPWSGRVLKFDEHARSKRVRSPSYADVAKPISKRAIGRWQKYQKYFEPHLDKLAPFLKAFGYDD